jgi:Ran GTPase-activating protein (RanGAP) involved in mRNA processing and transport
MTAKISSKDEVDEFIKLMRDKKNIPLLKLNCNFDGLDKNSYRKNNESKPDARSTTYSMQGEILNDKAFQEILNACENVQALDLSGCRLTDNNCQDLVAYLKKNPTLQGIRLGDGDVITGKNLSKIGTSIKQSTTLQGLVLKDMLIDANNIVGLIDSLDANKSLTSLKLQNLEFTKYTLMFSNAFDLASGTNIEAISLAGTKLGMTNTLGKNGKLPAEISVSIRNSAKLQKLDLTDCHLTYAETDEIAEVIAYHQGIQELILEGNEVSPATLEKIKVTLQRNASPASTPQSNVPADSRSTGQD